MKCVWHQGFDISKNLKLFVAFGFIIINIYFLFYYYLKDSLDYTWGDRVTNGINISARDQIMSKSFDCGLWLSLQFYQMWYYPDKMYLTSKIHIEWV